MILWRDKQVVFYKERTSEHTPVCDRREQRSKARDVPRYEAKKMVRPRGMFTSFHQARKIAVTLLYKLKTADLSCFDPEEKSLSKWQKTAI